jgi:hypothetical protein
MLRWLESRLIAQRQLSHQWAAVSCFLLAVLFLAGCPRDKQSAPPAANDATPATRASVTLRLVVVNEPGVAEAIGRLRGEWAERSGGALAVGSKSWKEIAGGKQLDADAVIFPSRYLGELCVRGWLRPARSSVLESTEFKADDVFPLVRRELMKWGGEVMALPLGLDWGPDSKSFEDHLGIAVLIYAAPAAVTNEHEGALFDPQTMKPRINEPAFVAALDTVANVGLEFFDKVPVFGWNDRMVAVTSASRNGASAFKLIAWLASAEISSQLARAGTPLMPVRRSLVTSAAWYDSAKDANARSTAGGMLATALRSEKCLLIPRIPGVDEYVAALDDAVKSVSKDKMPPQQALAIAAERWEKITDSHGRDQQRRAYLKHLGIDER